uniref:WD_REPEATS_REGION domain-containing protein n=1 Tax=Syphacia muris TaxID=451379 RepID=A0A0N5AJP8_9BILA
MCAAEETVSRKREGSYNEDEELLAKKLFGEFVASEEESSSDEEVPGDEDTCTTAEEGLSSLKPVWHDDDDDNLEVNLSYKRKSLRRITDGDNRTITGEEYERRLRDEFYRNQGTSKSNLKWASIEPDEKVKEGGESDSEDVEIAVKEVAAKAGKYLSTSKFLPKGVISFRRCNDISRGHRFGKKPLNAVHFHPSKPVLLTGGFNGVISLYEVGLPPTNESFLQDVHFKDFPISTAVFSEDGNKVIAGSRRQVYFFSYDLLDGKVVQMRTPREMPKTNTGLFAISDDGKYMAVQARNEIYVLSVTTMEVVCVLSSLSAARSLQFFPTSSNSLLAFTETSEVCLWDIRNAAGLRSFRDDGGVAGRKLRISSNSQFVACGSNTGIVNLYETKDLYQSSPKPIAVYDQLTTEVGDVVFSKDTQILLMSSEVKADAARLIHLRSRTLFTNFPCKTGSIGKPTVSDLSPNSGYLAIGDTNGFVSLFRLNYFSNY